LKSLLYSNLIYKKFEKILLEEFFRDIVFSQFSIKSKKSKVVA